MAVRDVVQAAAGVGGAGEYIEDVFSTYLYEGNGSTQTITNGIDLDGEGGLVWVKNRTGANNHILTDSARGTANFLRSNLTNAQDTNSPNLISAFNSNGFSLGVNYADVNASSNNYASWTFRKAPKFFDVVTYTGNGVARTIAHSLGAVPGMIIVKRTDGSNPWAVYHRGSSPTVPEDKELQLNATDGAVNGFTTWNRTLPTDTVFSVGTEGKVNESGWQYVAYLFAHDAGGFGDDGEQNVISCGSYVSTGTDGNFVSLGFEPQWVIIKNTNDTGQWRIFDNMRGVATGGDSFVLLAENATAEFDAVNAIAFNATGFTLNGTNGNTNSPNGNTYIYIAIRRPMKTPEAGTEVFSSNIYTGDSVYNKNIDTTITPDLVINSYRNADADHHLFDRLRGWPNGDLWTNATSDENVSGAPILQSPATMGSIKIASSGTNYVNYSGYNYVNHSFKRAPGFFDVVAYTGNGSAHAEAHNLGVVPEMIIVKPRSNSFAWTVYQKDAPISGSVFEELNLNSTNAWSAGNSAFPATAPTSTGFYLPSGTASASNRSGWTYVAYLFASLPGVSKVGSYSGTGGNVNVDCGFSAGARFILIKRADPGSTGDWYYWDSARGIVAGNDPYLLLNSATAEVTSTDYIDPLSSGFTVTSSAPAALNASGGSYIFLAIA